MSEHKCICETNLVQINAALLEALEAILALHDDCKPASCQEAIVTRAAIRAAKGGNNG